MSVRNAILLTLGLIFVPRMYRPRFLELLPHVGDVIVVATSSLYKRNVSRVLPVVQEVFEKWTTRIPTGQLNRWLQRVVFHQHPRAVKNRITKMKYIVQAKVSR